MSNVPMILFINNLSDEYKTFLALIAGQTCKIIAITDLMKKNNKSENILNGIDRLLAQIQKNVHDLTGIIVVNGPGSFVGIRVALSIANTIAWTKKIPAAGVQLFEGATNKGLIKKGVKNLSQARKGEPAMPFYGKEPNITKPKSK